MCILHKKNTIQSKLLHSNTTALMHATQKTWCHLFQEKCECYWHFSIFFLDL